MININSHSSNNDQTDGRKYKQLRQTINIQIRKTQTTNNNNNTINNKTTNTNNKYNA